MFAIVTYDVNARRNSRILKICRRYLNHVQQSVFEGMITEAKLALLEDELFHAVDKSEDQVMVYKFDSLRYTSKDIIGICEEDTNII